MPGPGEINGSQPFKLTVESFNRSNNVAGGGARANAPASIVVQDAGSVTVLSAVHPAKQSDGISVIDVFARFTVVIAVLPAKTPCASSVTPAAAVGATDVESEDV